MPAVLGPTIDDQTRCVHYGSTLDVVAIRFACCGEFYPCHRCHAECADHDVRRWPVAERSTEAVLCGVCDATLTIAAYLDAEACPHCAAPFNPGCPAHAPLYFEVEG